jgi:hypothetical protein
MIVSQLMKLELSKCEFLRLAALLSKKTWASEAEEPGIMTVYWFRSHAQAPYNWLMFSIIVISCSRLEI